MGVTVLMRSAKWIESTKYLVSPRKISTITALIVDMIKLKIPEAGSGLKPVESRKSLQSLYLWYGNVVAVTSYSIYLS
jgi:hypothetical protein